MHKLYVRFLASPVFRNISLFIGAVAAILTANTVSSLVNTVDDHRRERVCWSNRTAEVDVLQAKISAVTSQIFVVAIINPDRESRQPELEILADELDSLITDLRPAIDRQEEATRDC